MNKMAMNKLHLCEAGVVRLDSCNGSLHLIVDDILEVHIDKVIQFQANLPPKPSTRYCEDLDDPYDDDEDDEDEEWWDYFDDDDDDEDYDDEDYDDEEEYEDFI